MDVSTVKKPAVPAAAPPQRTERVEKAPPSAGNETQKLQEAAAQKAANAPSQPVINTQGHSTGRLLNVTA